MILKPSVLCLFIDSDNFNSIAILHHRVVIVFDYICVCVHSFLLPEVSNCLSSSFSFLI